MADPIRYKVRVHSVFHFHNETFEPGKQYWVTPLIFNDALPDGRNFKDLCEKVEKEYPVA